MISQETIPEIVRRQESDFTSGLGTLMSDYVREDLYTDINTIYAYLNSKHISGEYDSLGREKPFFNIVLAARNIWFRATDIDRRNIILTPTKIEETVAVFLISVILQNWMKEERFGRFLNNWGLELAGFNSAVVKFIEKEGRLIPSVVPWSRLIVDQINFDQNPKIEILQLTESQMYERYDTEKVEQLCERAQTIRETTDKQKQDNKSNYYKVYEIHGVFPLSYITHKESDEDTFVQQMHVVSFVYTNDKNKDVEDFILYSGREEKDPYMLTSLMPSTDGSISLNGSVKNLFEAQWMMNHTVKSIKDQLDLASKLIFQTSDGNFLGQNALFAIESGDILIHQPNQPLTQINNNSHDITALQNFGEQWKSLSNEINGISDAMLGAQPKSGTAWRQTEALLQENYSLFEIMVENKGLDLEEMLRVHIIPFILKRKLNNSKEIIATLDMYGIDKIEEKFIKNKTREEAKKELYSMLIGEKELSSINESDIENNIRSQLQEQGNQRFFKPSKLTWKDELKGIEYNIDIDITGESKDKQAMYSTLNTALQAVTNPNFESNKKAQFIVDKILTATGHVTPLELSSISQPATKQLQPQGGGAVDKLQVEQLQTNQQ